MSASKLQQRQQRVQLQLLDSSNPSSLLQRRMLTMNLELNVGHVSGNGIGGGQERPVPEAGLTAVNRAKGVGARSSFLAMEELQLTAAPLHCNHCGEALKRTDRVLRTGTEPTDIWHERCLRCAQCFRPFQDGRFYEFDGRLFCEHDFSVLFKPCCNSCGNYIIGPLVRALQASWHPACFTCQRCNRVLADAFVKSLGRALCRDCSQEERMCATAKYLCNRCKDVVDEAELVRYRGDNYHAYHFACTDCRCELTAEAREKDDQLYCVRCFDRLGLPVCARCRRPIDQERVIHALGRAWHVEHFVCAACEKPFNGTRHFERRGLAYCEMHFQQLFGRVCFHCSDTISDECVQACGKSWCRAHFRCTVCDRQLDQRSKFYEYDLKPVCKKCYKRFPTELRKRLAKMHKKNR